MNLKLAAVLVSACLMSCLVRGQTMFDFENATVHSSLPLSLTVDGLTAQFSATGQGFSIQPADTMGFTPAGFSGNCIYPNSVFAADLNISFSETLSQLSILYAPQELACDSSARMRVTAFMDRTQAGTATMTADPPGTWPSATLAINALEGFNRVVIHYDAPPPTGGDWGPIFMADNLAVTVVPEPETMSVLIVGLATVYLLKIKTWKRRQATNSPKVRF